MMKQCREPQPIILPISRREAAFQTTIVDHPAVTSRFTACYCGTCGSMNEAGSRYCGMCGSRLATGVEGASQRGRTR
ncbi:zinc-ribbon domain-containing protein [Reticulibacter mediterranei]|uniref:zinc-ribbon domain-containing protein n=1 Tax=Reticulibacter mediterranei TaxID=2778369 RepID=UPI001C689565|nr:zinc-ribbon domain-containing protein [Reticulibacter mediterranei]